MNREQIITELYNSNLFEKMASTYSSKLGDAKEDWIQNMYLIACEIPEDRLIELYEKKELNYYLFYIGKAQAYNDKSEFWKETKGRIDIAYSMDDPNYQELKRGDYE